MDHKKFKEAGRLSGEIYHLESEIDRIKSRSTETLLGLCSATLSKDTAERVKKLVLDDLRTRLQKAQDEFDKL